MKHEKFPSVVRLFSRVEHFVCLFFVCFDGFNVPVNIFQSCRDGATIFWVLTSTLGF